MGEALPDALRPEAPRPQPPPPAVDLAALRVDLEGAAGRHAGRYGVVAFDPDSGSGVSLGGEQVFTAASVGKLPTLLALYRAAARGELDLDDKISILHEDYQGYGTGVLHNFAPGTEITLRECAYYLVNKSDNTAWAMLDRRLGVGTIQAEMAAIGAAGTDYGMGTTTPEDVFLMLRKISDPSFTDGKLSGEMISAMTDTAFEDRIPASLPPDVRVAHKIGSYEDSYGDAGIVFYKDRDGVARRYFIVVLSGGTGEGSARAAMQEISLTTYRHLAAPGGRAPRAYYLRKSYAPVTKPPRLVANLPIRKGRVKERDDPQKTAGEVLRRFRVPAQGSTFAGQPVTGPLLVDETGGVPVPIPSDAPVPSPVPGGVA
ncbi:MAG: class A beta-lactamase-related serine hydrolase [Actinomycetota bacterium]|nr:class A beta-lactamase-related serine hydrolase [Actinomycetota bacterium]